MFGDKLNLGERRLVNHLNGQFSCGSNDQQRMVITGDLPVATIVAHNSQQMKQNNKNHSALDDILSPPTRDVRVFMRQAGRQGGEVERRMIVVN